jgi:N-acetylmuramic acid 6-phosphate etherase
VSGLAEAFFFSHATLTTYRSTIGVEGAVSSISQAVQLAVDSHPDASGRRFQDIHFKSIRIGIAGYSRPALASSIDKSLEALFRTPINEGLRITDDVHLLTATAELKPDIQNLIVLLAGTGSIVMAYKRDEKSQFYQSGRVGGWGHLLGDDGSGYAISREAIRKALRFYERQKLRRSAGLKSEDPSRLCRAVVQHFQGDNCSETDLLSSVLSSPPLAQEPERGQDLSKTSHIASFAQHVLGLAYDGDAESRKIADASAAELAEMVILLAETQRIDLATTGLALTGGLMKNKSFSEDVLGLIRQRCGDLKCVDTISDTAQMVASQLSII